MSSKFFNDQIISQIIDISKLAGIEIMKIYKTDFSVKIKSDHFFEINLDEISSLRKITGIVDVIRTN